MELHCNAVDFSFKTCCSSDFVKVNISDILEAGIPICPECGNDRELVETCSTNITARHNELTMEQSRELASNLVDGYELEGVIETCIDATELWINAQPIEELRECVDAEIYLDNL